MVCILYVETWVECLFVFVIRVFLVIVLFGVEALFVLVDMIGVLVVILVVILGCFRVVIVRTVVSKSRISVVVICLVSVTMLIFMLILV